MLKQLVAELTRLEERADKWRDKRGRIEISADEYNRLAVMTGGRLADEPGELTIEEYVGLIDEAIDLTVSRLKVREAMRPIEDAIADIAGEI